MTSQAKKRRLPRFGLKSLFILVLVVAAYFGSWSWVEERAIRDVKAAATLIISNGRDMPAIVFDDRVDPSPATSAIAPYILVAPEHEIEYGISANDGSVGVPITGWHDRYYFWLFGWTVRLPITSPS